MLDPVSLATIFTSLIPTANYAVRRYVDYKTGGKNPSNATEDIASREADVKMIEAQAKADNAEGASQWVINVRALQRPIVVYTVLFNWSLMTICGLFGIPVDLQIYVILANMASSVFFYLFGDRTLMYSLQTLNKKLTS